MAPKSTRAKIGDLRARSDSELRTRLADLRREQFNLRIQKATGQLANVARVAQVKREIAQVQTLLAEMKRKAKAA